MIIRGAERFAYGSTNVVDARDYDRAMDQNEALRIIARRIADARERDDWNELDDAVDDLLAASAVRRSPDSGKP